MFYSILIDRFQNHLVDEMFTHALSFQATCLKENEPCPIGYYMEWAGPAHGKLQVMAGRTVSLCSNFLFTF